MLLAGPGGYSLDAALGIRYPEPLTQIVAAAVVIAGVTFAFVTRGPAPAPAPAADREIA